MAQAMSIRVGNPIRKLVLLKLADNANDKGECWPSYKHIADQCEIGRSTVKSHIKALEDMGLVRREFRKNGVLNQSNLFYLTLDKPVLNIPEHKVARKKSPERGGHVQEEGVGQDLTGVGQELTGGGSGAAPGGGSGAAPITSHSFEPVIEPKNNTHTASSKFESVDNFATAPTPTPTPTPECSDTYLPTGEGQNPGVRLASGPPAPEQKNRPNQALQQDLSLPDASERKKNLISMNSGEFRECESQLACQNSNTAGRGAAKFVMFEGWRPSSGLRGTARKIGIELSGPPDKASLADFVTFWVADGAAYNQIQWEMKLARSMKTQRQKLPKRRSARRDCTLVTDMNYPIPEGFRGT